jgi:uncharacterized protein involved in type VI secretion and phage assembly
MNERAGSGDVSIGLEAPNDGAPNDGAPSDGAPRFALRCDRFGAPVRVLEFTATEALSTLYRFEILIGVASDERAAFDSADAVGARASFVHTRGDSSAPMTWHGALSRIAFAGDDGATATYRAELVPRLWWSRLDRHSNVFSGRTLLEIVSSVLEDAGLVPADDFVFRLDGHREPLEELHQHRESAFAFVSRLLEREGVYYFFEQREGREVIVFTDAGHNRSIGDRPVHLRHAGDDRGPAIAHAGHEYLGRGTAHHLRPGYTFDLCDPLRGELEYLTVALEHAGGMQRGTTDRYDVRVTAVRADAGYRPERGTPIRRESSRDRAFFTEREANAV